MYRPENQIRCTIIRGKSQSDMEDLLPLYANMVHKYCPCEEDVFKKSSRVLLSKTLFNTESFENLSEGNQKTVNNHLTEIAGTLLGLYYSDKDESGTTYVYESESCKFLIEYNDYPTFFKNICLNLQFPNGAKKIQFVKEDIEHELNIRPLCYVVSLLYYAQQQPAKQLLTKQEIGYYVLNNLDVLQGKVPPRIVYDRIMLDRKSHVRRDPLRGSKDWQHIKEQFNLLELANIVEVDRTYIWLNKNEKNAISIFLKTPLTIGFDCYSYKLTTKKETDSYFHSWEEYYGRFNKELLNAPTLFTTQVDIVGKEEQVAASGAFKSSIDLGDEGEALVFKLEQERVRKYKERLVNKVLLLGKTKGLGYDISSIEADEDPTKPEFARYIEVKSTKRVTEPSFDAVWADSINITAKEWIAAEQHGQYYNIYRVYFTKNKTFIVRIKNPYQKVKNGEIEIYPTIYQINFGSAAIDIPYGK